MKIEKDVRKPNLALERDALALIQLLLYKYY